MKAGKLMRFAIRAVALLLAATILWFFVNRLTSHKQVVRVVELADKVPSVSSSTLRIATWNVSRCRGQAPGYDPDLGGPPQERAARARAIGAFLKDHAVDIVVLTEVDFGSSWSGGIDHATLIAESGGFGWMVQIRNEDIALPWWLVKGGMAVLSRFPVVTAEPVELPNPDGWQQWASGSNNPWSSEQKRWEHLTSGEPMFGLRRSAAVDIQLPGERTIRVAGFHWPSVSRKLQQAVAERCVEIVGESPYPMVLAGDFNLVPRTLRKPGTPDNALDLLLDSAHLKATPPHHPPEQMLSFPARKPAAAIDLVLVPSDWPITATRALPSPLCDHLPVVAQIRIE